MSSIPGEPSGYHANDAPPLRLLAPYQLTENELTQDIDWSRDLFEHSRDLLCVHDLEGLLLSVNPIPARLLGYTVEEILKVPIREVLDPKFRDQFESYLRQLVSAGQATGILAVLTRSGQRRFWEYHSTVRTEGAGQPFVLGIGHDVTENFLAQKALLAANEQLVNTVREREEGVRQLTLFRTLLDHSHDAIMVIEPVTLRLFDVNERICMDLGYTREELLGMSVYDVAPYFNRDSRARVLQQLEQSGFAILESIHRRKDGSTFPVEVTLREVHLERKYGIAVARDITERKCGEEARRDAERNLRILVENLPDCIARFDTKRRLTFVSPAAERLFGGGETLGKTLSEHGKLGDPALDARLEGMIQEALDTGVPNQAEIEVQTLHGPGVFEIRHIPERDESGKIVSVLGITRDISLSKQAEAAVLESHKKLAETSAAQEGLLRSLQLFRTLLDHSNDAIEVVDPATMRLLDVNEKSCAELGYTREELLSMTVYDIDPDLTPEQIAQPDDPVVKNGFAMVERVHRRKDGTTFPVEVGIRHVQLDKEYRVAISRDITERKQREGRLQEYERVLEALDEMIVVLNRDHRYVLANRAFLRYRGLTSEHLFGRHITDFVDIDSYRNTIKPRLDQSFGGQVVNYEMNRTFPHLGERNLAITYLPVEGPAGIDRVAAVLKDVTDSKRAAAQLEASEQRFRAVHDHAPAGIGMVNPGSGRFIQVNPKYCEIVGRTEEEMLGLTFPEITHPADRAVSASMAAQMFAGKIRDYNLEKRYLRPDGSVVWVDLSVVPMWAPGKEARQHMAIVQDITERRRGQEELRQAKEKLAEEKLYLEKEIEAEFGFDNIIGQSQALKSVMESVAKVAASDATVLLLGETGTGKELIARAIHRQSRRAGNAFIKMNCAAIPTGLLESELFGNEKGAFTGAVTKKIGRLELADRGTLLLDEIGEISLALQPKLLRVLQDQEFERLGGRQTLKVNFRLIAATNSDLAKSVQEKHFRSDLFYRLNVFPIFIPPLRERREDIPLLAEHFVRKIALRMKKSITGIPKKTMDALVEWPWPGNVRELENFIERSLILTAGSVLTAPLAELQSPSAPPDNEQTLEAAQRRHILAALHETRGQISGPRGAAARLGLKRTTLQSKLKHLGINARAPN